MAVGLRDGCSRQNGPCYAQWRRERPPTPTRRWSLRTLEHDTLERFETSVGVRIDPAATMHARAASMHMACSMQLHACLVPRRRARIRIQLYIMKYSCIVRAFIEQMSVRHPTVCLGAPRGSFTFYRFRKREQKRISNSLNLHYQPVI